MNIEKIRELVNEAEESVDDGKSTETYLLLDAIRAELDKVQESAEPVGWMSDIGTTIAAAEYKMWRDGNDERRANYLRTYTIPLYTHPPQAQQPGKVLTDDKPFVAVPVDGTDRWKVVAGDAYSLNGLNKVNAIWQADKLNWAYQLGRASNPAVGLTVDEAYEVWHSFHFRHQNYQEKFIDYFEARNAAYRDRLTAAINAKAAKQ
jgi:hypothetical protein